jgi:TolB protein
MNRLTLLVRSMAFAVLAAGVAAAPAKAQLRVEITSGVTDPIPVAVVPFEAARALPVDLASVVDSNLRGTGRFAMLARERMPQRPADATAVDAAQWRAQRIDYVVVARSRDGEAGGVSVDYALVNALTGQTLLNERLSGAATVPGLRNLAHRLSDRIHERMLGVRGAFATRIAYVSVDGKPPAQRYQLIVADADGENARVVLESRQPLMSPTWSADGEWLAYVSFEGRVSGVYVQRVRTGERRRVSARLGINGAPAFSPDGRRLALTLSGSGGNLDIYTLDLSTQALTRITDDPAIDTEPEWSRDGTALYFTSDRAGGPQIYRLQLASGERPRRVSFGSSYNARARLSPDGRQLAMVTQEGGAYRIALQNLETGAVTVLTRGRGDESPSFAPNGAVLMYAGRERGQDILATVSADGLATQRLKSDRGEVRDPAWGPFLK